MADTRKKKRRPKTVPLADLIGEALEPVCRRRGFAAADLLINWPDVVGGRYAETTQPERLNWPRGDDDEYAPAQLRVRCEGHAALDVPA